MLSNYLFQTWQLRLLPICSIQFKPMSVKKFNISQTQHHLFRENMIQLFRINSLKCHYTFVFVKSSLEEGQEKGWQRLDNSFWGFLGRDQATSEPPTAVWDPDTTSRRWWRMNRKEADAFFDKLEGGLKENFTIPRSEQWHNFILFHT